MKNNKCSLLLIFGIFALQSFAQIVPLDSILIRIEKNNPMLKMFDEQIVAANSYSEGARSWMPPSLSSGPWQTPYKDFRGGMWMITGQQMIPNPAKLNANFNYMQGMAPIEQQGKYVKRNELFTSAKMNYYEWVVLKHKYAVLVQIDSLLNYVLTLANLRYTYNKEKLTNIYKSQADIYELRNMETMLLGEMRLRNIELNTLMNQDKNIVFDVDTAIKAHFYELSILDSSIISSSRSDIKQIEANIHLIELQQQFEKSKLLPEFGISASHMQSLGMMPSSYAAMGMITIPIVPWSAKEYKSNIKALNSTVNSLDFKRQVLINETEGLIAMLQTQIKSSKLQLHNYAENIIPTYIKSYQASMIGYEQNTEELFLVLDGLRMYRMAKMNELDQTFTLLKLQVEYEEQMEIR